MTDQPTRPEAADQIGLPPWAYDRLYMSTTTRFSLRDRLRILLTGTVHTYSKIDCAHPPGKTQAETQVLIERVRLPWRRRPEPETWEVASDV